MRYTRIFIVAVLFAAGTLLSGCGDGLGTKLSNAAKKKKEKTHFEIFQPNAENPEDKVLIWTTASRDKRSFQLRPGKRVKILKTVDGATCGQQWDMYKIQTEDKEKRQGWVPSSHCKEKKGK